jgi:flavin reductase (DIM6/NTAB) family NADH-FMN oxidoreductase RutF
LSIDATTFRRIMGCFATGVGVVTTDNDGRLHGLTANSITSVSLDPMLMLVCVDKIAHGHAEMRRCSSFGISILAADQRDISSLFAKTGEPELGSLRGVPFRAGQTGCPLLENAIAHFECAPHAEVDAGDHTIFVGRVLHADHCRDDVGPLLYYRGAYREIG